jgi:hypothetical protein
LGVDKTWAHAFFYVANAYLNTSRMRNDRPCAMNKTELIQKIKQLEGISQDESASCTFSLLS